MKRVYRPLALITSAFILFGAGGCTNAPSKESSVPKETVEISPQEFNLPIYPQAKDLTGTKERSLAKGGTTDYVFEYKISGKTRQEVMDFYKESLTKEKWQPNGPALPFPGTDDMVAQEFISTEKDKSIYLKLEEKSDNSVPTTHVQVVYTPLKEEVEGNR